MSVIERWWRIDFHDRSEWTNDEENALDAREHYDYPVTGPFVLEANATQGAVAAGDALADAVSDIMADDPESVLHTWARRWRESAHPGGR